MNDLISLAIEAQGGLDRWKQFRSVTAHLSVGGYLWEKKGHAGVIEEVNVAVDLLEQSASHMPGDQWHTLYTPERTAIETQEGNIVEELYDPRSSFNGHTWETKWSNLQLAYFSGYATWNYFNTPFQFARPGFEIKEIRPWQENGEAWRRLKVEWPPDIHTHSREQVLYIDEEGLIRRLDYKVEVAGNTACAHYLSDYKEISGIRMATKRVVYLLGEDNMPQPETAVVVSIVFSNVKFS